MFIYAFGARERLNREKNTTAKRNGIFTRIETIVYDTTIREKFQIGQRIRDIVKCDKKKTVSRELERSERVCLSTFCCSECREITNNVHRIRIKIFTII